MVVTLDMTNLSFLMLSCSQDKVCGARVASCWCCEELRLPPKDPVPVLVVYPAKNSVFQQAVVALAEFLQQHGRCRVAIDMWQQEKIAELGPMRWLAREAEAAQYVLIVSPLAGNVSGPYFNS